MRTIGAAFGVPVDSILRRIERQEAFPIGHLVAGNQIRHAREVHFDPDIKNLRPALPRWAALATLVICWPLMRRYGYGLAADLDSRRQDRRRA